MHHNFRNKTAVMKANPNSPICMVEFTGSHDFSYVSLSDTLPFDPKVDPNYSIDPVTFERKRVTVGSITYSNDRSTDALKKASFAVDEMQYRKDDICGDALLSDDEGGEDEGEEDSNFMKWRHLTPIECALLEGDHPSGEITEGDSEGELLLATEADCRLADTIVRQKAFINRMYPKAPPVSVTTSNKPSPHTPPTSRSQTASGSAKSTHAENDDPYMEFTSRYVTSSSAKKRDFDRDKLALEKTPEINARTYLSLLTDSNSVSGVTDGMNTYVDPSVWGGGIMGMCITFKGVAGVCNAVNGVEGQPGKTEDDDEVFWKRGIEGILKGGENGREHKLKRYLEILKMQERVLKGALEKGKDGGGGKREREEGEGDKEGGEKKQKVKEGGEDLLGKGGEEMVTQ